MSTSANQVIRKSRFTAAVGDAVDTSRRRCDVELSYLEAYMLPLIVSLKENEYTSFTASEDMLLYSFVMNICRHCPEKARDRGRVLSDIARILHSLNSPASQM